MKTSFVNWDAWLLRAGCPIEKNLQERFARETGDDFPGRVAHAHDFVANLSAEGGGAMGGQIVMVMRPGRGSQVPSRSTRRVPSSAMGTISRCAAMAALNAPR